MQSKAFAKPYRTRSSENGKVILVGDSAHALLPWGGHVYAIPLGLILVTNPVQGAGLGIEDAAVLTELLTHLQSIGSISRLAKIYYDLRSKRIERCRVLTKSNGPAQVLPDGPEQERRDRYLQSPPENRTDPKYNDAFGDFDFHVWLNSFDVVKEVRNDQKHYLPAWISHAAGAHKTADL